MGGIILLYTTVATKRQAERLSEQIIEKELAACANITRIRSIYRWEGKPQKTGEYSILFKSTKAQEKKLESEIKRKHPYKLPCIIKVPASASKEYGGWIIDSTKNG